MRISFPILPLVFVFVLVTQSNADETFTDQQIEFFEKQVRPILASNCYECHSGKSKKLKAELRLDHRSHVIQGGESGAAIVPGKPDESLLIEAVNYESFEMPPQGKLQQHEIDALTKWVEMGAPWPEETITERTNEVEFDWKARKSNHWAWQAVSKPDVPSGSDSNWPLNPIDNFILSKLDDQKLKPANEADKRSQIRRLYFDLIGLPPTPNQIHDFLDDNSQDAYATVVDDLLSNEHFGEKWARHWMDLVRYGETLGHEFDYPLHYAYRYRDYLIRAFNLGVPYDQFVTEHIAGDLIPEPRLHVTEKYNESIIGTGFWFLGEAVHAPTDVKADESDRIDNQIDVMCKTFLGLTVGCARCHDHKFDPIPTTDYYALAGFIQSSRRQEGLLDPHNKIADLAEQIDRIRNRGIGRLQTWIVDQRRSSIESLLMSSAVAMQSAEESNKVASDLVIEKVAHDNNIEPKLLNRFLKAIAAKETDQLSHPMSIWRRLVSQPTNTFLARRAALAAEVRAAANAYEESIKETPLFEDFTAGFDQWHVTGHAFKSTSAAEWDSQSEVPKLVAPHLAHSGLKSNRFRGVLRSPTFVLNHREILYRISAKDVQIRLIVDGFTMDIFNALLFGDATLETVNTLGETWVRQHEDLYHYLGHRAHIEIIDHRDGFAALDEIRFSNGTIPTERPSAIAQNLANDETIDSLEKLAERYDHLWQQQEMPSGKDSVAFVNWIIEHGFAEESSPELKSLSNDICELERQIPDPIHVIALADGDSENEHVFIRGNHKNLGAEVPRRMLVSLQDEEQPQIERGSGRLELAHRMTDPTNPFISRVIVNRIWHHLMGRGIVPSTDDFGKMGQPPTHPELLDWLASDFVDQGWSIKKAIRQIVMSRTYRMSSRSNNSDEHVAKVDPANNYLHKARIRRHSAESIRDSILQISGRLDPKLYGPSVPVHLNPFMEGRGRPAQSGPLDGDGRRSIYVEIRRNFLSPMMLAFDMPSPFNTMGKRSSSNVPSQSLILMNDPFVLGQARRWAERLMSEKDVSVDARIDSIFETAIGRLPSEKQRSKLCRFVDEQSKIYETDPNDVRVWTDLCHTVMNMKEFIYLN